MPKFSSASKQAASVMKEVQGTVLESVGTVRNYEQCLTRVAEWSKSEWINNGEGLRSITPDQAQQYLEQRGETVGQKTLDMERQAIQVMMQHVTHKIDVKDRLEVVKSEHEQALTSRAYTSEQISAIASAQTEKHALATELAHAAGLRAHELITIQPASHRAPDDRPALETKFKGREGQTYTVQGKGGLVREVILPNHLAERLESRRLETPERVTDRGIHCTQHYALGGGKNWSGSFTAAAGRTLGWSEGAHGVRHAYAQERMVELQVNHGLSRELALETVSQEMGHFRPEITETYLR